MPLPFSLTRASSFHRLPKRKLRGSAPGLSELGQLGASSVSASASCSCEIAITFDDDDAHGDAITVQKRAFQRLGDGLSKTAVSSESVSSSSSWRWFCGVCQTVDARELAGFVVWEALVVLVVVLAVADWVFLFRFVVAPEDPSRRAQYGAAWASFTALLVYVRQYMRALCGAPVRALADHAEIFVAVSLVMVFATNVAFFLHTPSAEPLRDLGFLLVPAQDEHSPWRPLSDRMTVLLPIACMVQSYLMTRGNRCRVMTTFFRVATVCYALRTLTVALTSLPGPAPHCRPGSALYAPPTSWLDVVTRVGPMYGKFFSCGDLIFSGHMAYTNSAMLLYLRTLDMYFPRFARLRWLAGSVYMAALAVLCIAGRKHYTVDIVLGLIISTLVFFHFEHGWVPACLLHSEDGALRRSKLHAEKVGHRRGDGDGDDTGKRWVPATSSSRSQSDRALGANNRVYAAPDAMLKRIVVVDDDAEDNDKDERGNAARSTVVEVLC